MQLPLFERVKPFKLSTLSRGEGSKLSPESITAIIDDSFKKILNKERIDIAQLNTIITFFDKISDEYKIIFKNYLNTYLGISEQEDEATLASFNELFPIPFLQSIIDSDFLKGSLNEQQSNSFHDLFNGNLPPVDSAPEKIIDFINSLKINRSKGFTNGQIRISAPFLKQSNFGSILENNFEALLEFSIDSRIDFPSGVARFLDIQLGKRLDSDPEGIRVKVFNEALGYYKFQNFVTKNNLPDSGLPNLRRLKDIIINLNNAIKILSEQEPKRGLFWKQMLDHLDGLEIQKLNSTSNYRVAVAFYVTNFVFCDFGPTGHAIHIYDRNTFDLNVRHQKDWKQADHTTLMLGSRKVSHLGSWEEDVKRLVLRARR